MNTIESYLKDDVINKDNFIDYSQNPQFDKATDNAASWRWDHSTRLENDKGFSEHQIQDFLLRYGFADINDFRSFLNNVNTIAEIGAGEGRVVDWYLKYSNAKIFALEISDSVYYLKEKYKNEPRVKVIKADALKHPFLDGSIDLLSCEQSIHHAPNPSMVFDALAKALHPGSKVILSVYAKKSPVREKMDMIIRDSISKLPPEEIFKLSKDITDISKILNGMNVKVAVPADFLEFGNLAGREMSLQRFFYFAIFKCFWNEDFTYEKSQEFNYDWYSYPVCNKTSLDEGCKWFIRNKISIHHIDSNDSNINLRGVRN